MKNIFDIFEEIFGHEKSEPEPRTDEPVEKNLTGKKIHVDGKLYRIEIQLRTIPVTYYMVNVNDEKDCIVKELQKKNTS